MRSRHALVGCGVGTHLDAFRIELGDGNEIVMCHLHIGNVTLRDFEFEAAEHHA